MDGKGEGERGPGGKGCLSSEVADKAGRIEEKMGSFQPDGRRESETILKYDAQEALVKKQKV